MDTGKHLNLLRIFSYARCLHLISRLPCIKEASTVVLFIYRSFWPANYNQVLPLLKKMLQVGWLSSVSERAKEGSNIWVSKMIRILKNGNGLLISPIEGFWFLNFLTTFFMKRRSRGHPPTAKLWRCQAAKTQSWPKHVLSGENTADLFWMWDRRRGKCLN